MIALSLLALPLVVHSCDTTEALNKDIATPFNSHNGLGSILKSVDDLQNSAPLTLLPQNAGDESPACLDGSPYGFYFVPSTTGSTQWTISIEGGGWCYDEDLCYSRSKTPLGTSKNWAPKAGCGCMNTDENGPVTDCNCIYMPYGDGASFSGYRAKPWPVPGTNNETLTFRGIKNLDATVEWALAHGLSNATEFVLTGGSAGGLSTFLHSDRVAAQIRAANPTIEKIRAAPVVGYFLDHDNYRHTTGTPNTPSWKQENYTNWMHYIYTMQNLTFGNDGGLTEACQMKHPNEPWLCFMSPHMQDVIQTPFFVFNSKFDAWQLANELQTGWKNTNEQAAVKQYGLDFLKDFTPVTSHTKNGAFITSCICHGCPWNAQTLNFNNLSPWQAYADWYTDKTNGAEAIHIDPRMPNGGGSTNIDPKYCAAYP